VDRFSFWWPRTTITPSFTFFCFKVCTNLLVMSHGCSLFKTLESSLLTAHTPFRSEIIDKIFKCLNQSYRWFVKLLFFSFPASFLLHQCVPPFFKGEKTFKYKLVDYRPLFTQCRDKGSSTRQAFNCDIGPWCRPRTSKKQDHSMGVSSATNAIFFLHPTVLLKCVTLCSLCWWYGVTGVSIL